MNDTMTPLGNAIRKQLTDKEFTLKEFSIRTGLSEEHLSQLFTGEAPLTHEDAHKLEMVLGIPASYWNSLEADYREFLIRKEEETQIQDEMAIVDVLPYARMVKYQWIEQGDTDYEKTVSLRKFFEVTDLTSLSSLPVFQSTHEKMDYATLAWLQQAKKEARKANVKPFNRNELSHILPSLFSTVMDTTADNHDKLSAILAEIGIVLAPVLHPYGHSKHTHFRDKHKIILVFTPGYGEDGDYIWQELNHILYTNTTPTL
ncbi:MAG: helix-turn-helix transcriptional regulator [Erysipelotrichaceae bacterium]|nr:helix-turn-helix transcriptional regulator [Erysipelotrichaceae bacterium]